LKKAKRNYKECKAHRQHAKRQTEKKLNNKESIKIKQIRQRVESKNS